MYTKSSILADLARLNAPQNVPVLVHTSLRAVGEIEGRAEALLDALIEYFTADGGLLMIPTQTWNKLDGDLAEPTLDVTSPDTCNGTLPRIAAVHPMAHRSLHPTHSMAVFDGKCRADEYGPAEEYINGEIMVDTPTSPNGCYGRLFDEGGKILLLGVIQSSNSYLHSVEERLKVPNRLAESYVPTKIRLRSGDIIERPIRYYHAEGIEYVSQHYPKYEPAFRHHGAIVYGIVGHASVRLCDARKMAEVMALVRERSGGVELMADDEPLKEEYYI